LIQEGDSGDTLFFILSGSVRSFSVSAWQDKEFTHNVLGPGSLFGEMGLDGGARSASVITLEATECVVIDYRVLKDYLLAQPELSLAFLNLVIQRARVATEAARNMALLDVYGRLRQFLTSSSLDNGGGEGLLRRRMTQKDIAYQIGASREMISRLLKDLELGGYVVVRAGSIVVTRELPERW
jgi:CRP/FNR family transcriptional regulator, cyclic AMP receptor protein